MNPVTLALGWLVPGAAHWRQGHRGKALAFGAMVLTLVASGWYLQGSNAMPSTAELQGVDGTARVMFLGGAMVKVLAGLPYFLLSGAGYSQSFLAGIDHEYGTKLLAMAGLVNLLALSDAAGKEKA